MFCPNCGTQLEDGALFCGSCGAKIAAPAQTAATSSAASAPAAPGRPLVSFKIGNMDFSIVKENIYFSGLIAAVVAFIALFLPYLTCKVDFLGEKAKQSVNFFSGTTSNAVFYHPCASRIHSSQFIRQEAFCKNYILCRSGILYYNINRYQE